MEVKMVNWRKLAKRYCKRKNRPTIGKYLKDNLGYCGGSAYKRFEEELESID